MNVLEAAFMLASLALSQEDFREFPLVSSNGISIHQGEWDIARHRLDGSTIVLKRNALQPHHVWLRYEYAHADAVGALSHIDLVQVDCSGSRTRVIQSDSFRLNNAQDHLARVSDLEWSVPLPDTLLEEMAIDLCANSF